MMTQRWHDLLFAHWRCSASDLRRLIPPPLELDTFDGTPWIGVVPFRMSGVRFRGTPPIPMAHAFLELNVRTYVTLDRRPGVWFFSLDAESSIAVIGARLGVRLPYFRATMDLSREGDAIGYTSDRWKFAGGPASFAATYQGVGDSTTAAPGSLDHFLTERYSLYASDGKRIWRGDIVHPPWRLQRAMAQIDRNSMLTAVGIHVPEHEPLLHFSGLQEVQLWRPVRVR
jgi:uncharacterized protein YqjF (DUF2071 family)